ncbi:YpjP family protein [Sporosarcina cyprini]|uniref:YpjP family protein n=1 Tax=Sporosarcina cyprini TaxID=2910523 RepID=UPI001EE11D35|nr:YpjP family protein [Sporosarcina cyprini]MCG3088823.1 YpjP family protein [Sporosarcina cyprini]
MRQYLQKLMMAAVAILTLGVISPSHEIWTNLNPKDDARESDHPSVSQEFDFGLEDSYFQSEPGLEESTDIAALYTSAKDLSYMKFGSKIGPVIQDEFDGVIFPKIEEVIQSTLESKGDLHKRRLAITETPSGNYAEKIFHVFDKDEEKDLIRFHVRTEKRPQDGFFYNFHYHTAEDDFIAHHSIGDIFWSKNTPPKWLS